MNSLGDIDLLCDYLVHIVLEATQCWDIFSNKVVESIAGVGADFGGAKGRADACVGAHILMGGKSGGGGGRAGEKRHKTACISSGIYTQSCVVLGGVSFKMKGARVGPGWDK